jgi:hypothetical protein
VYSARCSSQARRGVTAEEGQLGAHQARAVSAAVGGLAGVRGGRDVRPDVHQHPVGGDGRLAGCLPLPEVVLGERARPGREVVAYVAVRVDDEPPAGAVDRDDAALGELQDVVSGAHDRGDPAAAQQDRGVRRGASVGEHHPVHLAGVERGHLGGRQLPGDQDSRAGDHRHGGSGERGDDLPGDCAHVLGPGLQVRVRQCLQLSLHVGGDLGPRARRAEPPVDARRNVRGERVVVQQLAVGLEDGRGLGPQRRRRLLPGRVDLAAYVGERRLEPLPLLRWGSGRLVLRRAHRVKPPHRPDGQARRGGSRPGGGGAARRAVRRRTRPVARRRAGGVTGPRHGRRPVGRLAEPGLRQVDQGGNRGLRLRAGGGDLELVTLQQTENGDRGEAGGGHRPGTRGPVRDRHGRIEPPRLRHQARGGPGVHAVRVLHDDDRRRGGGGGSLRRGRRELLGPAEVRDLAQQRVPGFGSHLCPIRAAVSGDHR